MILIDNETNIDIDIKKLDKIAKYLSCRDIELIFCNTKKMQKLNYEFRGIDKATDVLSFPLKSMPNTPLGSIVICIDIARQKADELNHNLEDEIALLFIHGFLHLLGYDHENDSGAMRQEEEKLIKKFNLPTSLIIRNN